MSDSTWRCLVIDQGQISVRHIPARLEGIQQAVQGYIELVTQLRLSDTTGIDVYCNEEGKLHHMPPNCMHYNDCLVGPVVVLGANPSTGETISLEPDWDQHVKLVQYGSDILPTLLLS